MPTFDIVVKVDLSEVANAVNQASKELAQRYDFKGTDSSVELNEDGLALRSNSQGRLDAVREVLHSKLVRRSVDLRSLDKQPSEPAGGQSYRQLIKLVDGIGKDEAKDIVKRIKELKMKVQVSIQGDVVRVSAKKRDDLQAVMGELKKMDVPLPLTYTNFRN